MVLERCRYVKLVTVVVGEIDARQQELAALVETTVHNGRRIDPGSFRE
jgi:hypothetical protein